MRYTIPLLFASLGAALPVLAEVPRVMTDIPPVQSLAAQVMGDLGSPGILLDAGANAHDFQLRPSQVAELAQADLVIWVGPEMTPWLDRTLDGISDGGARLGLLTLAGTVTRPFTDGHGAEDHDPDEAAGDDHGHAEDGHDHAETGHDASGAETGAEGNDRAHSHEGADPHAWLDPGNARAWLAAIAAELSRLDPENAGAYAANARTAAAAITALDETVAARLQPVADRPFVVFHDAYGYFADHYGLSVAGTIAAGDAASPGAAHLKDLQASLSAGKALCIFPEANHDPRLVDIIVEGTGVRVGGALDPAGASLPPGPNLYAALMTGLAETLTACLTDG